MTVQNPIPQGKYSPAVRVGDLIFTAGMTPRREGKLIQTGQVKAGEPLENYKEAAVLCAMNAVNAARAQLNEGENITRIIKLMVFINAEQGFTAHAKLADIVSEYLCEAIPGLPPARSAIGMGTLPGDAPMEVELICSVI